MRIGLVIGQLTYGGAEGQLSELALGLRHEADVFVYCLSDQTEAYGARIADAGIPLRTVPARRRLDLGRVVQLARWLREDRVEIAHAFLFIASAYAYLATRMTPGVRVVTSARNCKLEPSAPRRWALRRAFQASDAIICNSQEMARFAVRHYAANSERIHVVFNGVDTERFQGRRHPRKGLVIGTAGRIEAQKNLEMFLVAAAQFHEARPEAMFEIVGDGSLRDSLVRRARELGIGDRVRFSGNTDDMPGFFGRIDQFWLTSNWEGTPNVLLEAMSAGVPVVATRVGGTSELIEDGNTGSVIEKGDAAAASATALRLVDRPDETARMARNARESVCRRFSIRAMIVATRRVYESAVGRRP